jgi:hypothetical protein
MSDETIQPTAIVKVEGRAESAGEPNVFQEPEIVCSGQLNHGQPVGNEWGVGSVARSAVVPLHQACASPSTHSATAGGGLSSSGLVIGGGMAGLALGAIHSGIIKDEDPSLSAEGDETFAHSLGSFVDVNVLGLYIPRQTFPNLLRNNKPERIKNVVLKPLLFKSTGETTLAHLLQSVMEQPCMAPTKQWFQAISIQGSGSLSENYQLYFEAYARDLKSIDPQFCPEQSCEPHEHLPHHRFSYTQLKNWGQTLDDIRGAIKNPRPEWLHIVFAIWQPRGVNDDVATPLLVLDLIRKLMPDSELLQSATLPEWGRWQARQDIESYLDAAACIVRDSILWDLEQLLAEDVLDKDIAKFRTRLRALHPLPSSSTSSKSSIEVVRELVKHKISLMQLISVKVYTLSLWAVCLDQGHWNQDVCGKYRTLHDVKSKACPTCGRSSYSQSFYKHILKFPRMHAEFKSSLHKFPKKTSWIYRGMDIPIERYSCITFQDDPRVRILVNPQRQPVGCCSRFPFHKCQRLVCTPQPQEPAKARAAAQAAARARAQAAARAGTSLVYETSSDASFSSTKEYVDSTYSVFNIDARFIQDFRKPCSCQCDSCQTANAQPVADQASDYEEFILRELSAKKNLNLSLASIETFRNFQLPPTEEDKNDEVFREHLQQAALRLVTLDICKWSQDKSTLLPGPLCSGTVLQFEHSGYDIDAVSAAKFATGVNENEVIVPAGFQFVAKTSQVEDILSSDGQVSHALTRMTLQPLININSSEPNEIAALPGMSEFRSAVFFCEKRGMLHGRMCYHWEDVEECTTKIWAPEAPSQWKDHITFGCTGQERPASQRTPDDKYKQFLEVKGRFAYLFDPEQLEESKPFRDKWPGYLISKQGCQVHTFEQLVHDSPSPSEHDRKTARDLDLRFVTFINAQTAFAGGGLAASGDYVGAFCFTCCDDFVCADSQNAGAAAHSAEFCLTKSEKEKILSHVHGLRVNGSPDMRTYSSTPELANATAEWIDDPFFENEHSKFEEDASIIDLINRTEALSVNPSVDPSLTSNLQLHLFRMAGAELVFVLEGTECDQAWPAAVTQAAAAFVSKP